MSERSSSRSSLQQLPEAKAKFGFVGLKNQGATCYLNALLQAMYMTPELRKGLYSIDPKEIGVDEVDDYEKQNARDETNEILLNDLLEMGLNEIGSRKSLSATKNVGVTQAVEYYWQHESDPDFNAPSKLEEGKKKKKKPRFIPIELQKLFTNLQLLNEKSISTEELTSKGFQWQGMDGRVQHDAHELNRLLIDALEKSLKNTSGELLTQTLYQGTLSNQIKCMNCNQISERLESFYDLNVQVDGCPDMAHALRQYTSAEIMQDESAYACEKCNSKQNALRFTAIKALPPILTLSCNRFKCDRTTNWMREKITSRSVFPLLIDMSDFKQGSPIVGKPLTLNQSNKDVDEDEDTVNLQRKMIWIDKVWEQAQQRANSLIDKYGTDISLTTLLPADMNDIDNADCSIKAYSESLSPNSKNEIYQLSAVIMHRGSAHSGHYFAYIRDSEKQGKWQVADTDYLQKFHLIEPGGDDDSRYDKQYFVSHEGFICVDESSVLRKVIVILQSCPNGSMSAQAMGKTIKSNLGCSWDEMFKEDYGTLNEFLKAFPIIFSINSETNAVSLSKTESMRYLSGGDFNLKLERESKLASDIPPRFAAGDDTITNTEMSLPAASDQKENDEWTIKTKKSKTKTQASKQAVEANAQKPMLIDMDSYNQHSATARMRKSSIFKLSSEIFNRWYGVYFEFNDNEVTPLPLVCLRKAFEGADSAYILVYKKLHETELITEPAEMDNTSIVSECSTATSTTKTKRKKAKTKKERTTLTNIPESDICTVTTPASDDATCVSSDTATVMAGDASLSSQVGVTKRIPFNYKTLHSLQGTPPSIWSQIVQSRNTELNSLRELLNQTSSQVTLKVFSSDKVVFNDPLFYLKPGMQADSVTLGTGTKIFEVVKQLRDHVPTFSTHHSSISVLHTCGTGYYPGNPWKSDALLTDVMEGVKSSKDSCINVLIWDGEMATCGDTHAPLKISVSYLARTTQELEAIKGKIDSEAWEVSTYGLSMKVYLWIHRSLSISKMCIRISEVLKLDMKKMCIHLVNVKKNSDITLLQSTTAAVSLSTGVGSRTRSVAGTSSGSKPTNKGMEPMLICKRGLFDDFKVPGLPIASSTAVVGTAKARSTRNETEKTSKATDDCAASILSVGDMVTGTYNGIDLPMFGDELLIEEISSCNNEPLAVTEIKRRNVAFEIEIHIEFSKQQLVALLESDEAVAIDLTGSDDQNTISAIANTDGEISFPSVLKLDFDRHSSMASFKDEILSKFGVIAEKYASLTQFRLGSFVGENIIEDEKQSLLTIGLHDDAVIFLELAEASTKKCSLNVVKVTGNSTTYKYTQSSSEVKKDPFEIRVRLNFTISKLKELIGHRIGHVSEGMDIAAQPVETVNLVDGESLQSYGFPSHRLRSASTKFVEPADLIAEFDDKGNAITVQSAGLTDGDTIFFEEGEPPKSGMMYFTVYLWRATPPINTMDQCSSSPATETDVSEVVEETPSLQLQFEALESSRIRHLSPVGEVCCNEEDTLSRLQELVFVKLSSLSPDSFDDGLPPADADHFLIRQLQGDLLPGQCWWTCSPPKSVHQKLDLTNIGKATTAGTSTKLSSTETSGSTLLSALKKKISNVSGKSKAPLNLVVMQLDKPQAKIRPNTPGAFKVWVQKLTNPVAPEEGMSVMDPEWPPLEFTIESGENPNLAHLKNFISNKLNLLNTSTQIYKLEVKSHTWSLLNPKKNESIKKYIKEGDLLCAFDEKLINSSKLSLSDLHQKSSASAKPSRTSTNQQQGTVIVSRFEDKYLCERAKKEKSIAKKQNVKRTLGTPRSPINGTKKRIVEVPLTLGGDLNFSDDEVDEN